MPLVPLNLPPGVFRNGTQYQAKGRWYDANLVRFYEATIRPWGGWQAHSASAVTGMARCCIVWQDPANLLWVGVLTHSKAYVYSVSGGQTDITPAGLTVGRPDAILTAGYGGGTYGTSTYGTARGGSTSLQAATVWTADTLEGVLVCTNVDDGRLWSWNNNTVNDLTQPAGSPVNNRAVFVSDEGFVMVLGAGGDPRNVQWPDQSSLTDWTPSTINQARSYSIATPGQLMCGCRMAGANIIFASTDVHLAVYDGLPAIYSFKQVGSGCGIISQGAFAKAETFVAWMSLNGFWLYDGATNPLQSEVADDVFKTLNVLQRSKIWALHNATFAEITWFYPVGAEIDHYVTFNYREKHWTNGRLARTCGIESGVFNWPLMVTTTGTVYQHENGLTYPGGTTPYIESGPLEVGDGENVFDIVGIEPDATTLGDVTGSFYTKFHAVDVDRVWGPYSMANPTSVRVSGREARLRLTSALTTDWRFGPNTRLDMRGGGLR